MAGPEWIRWLLTAVFVVAACHHTRRLAVAGRQPGYPGQDRATDIAHMVMCTGMAVMASPVGGPLSPASWLTLFLILTCCAAVRGRFGMALGCAAMGYMLAAGRHDAHHMSGPWVVHQPGLALPAVAWTLATLLVVHALWTLRRPVRAPQLVMALGMSYMLVAAV